MLICKRYADTLLPRTAHILKGLYDLDIVEETVLIEWHEKVEKVGFVNFNRGSTAQALLHPYFIIAVCICVLFWCNSSL